VRYDQLANVHCERRAFGTIALMLATLGLFFAPYMTLHVISLNLPAATDYLHASAVVYYMNLVSDIAIFVLKRDVKLQLTDYYMNLLPYVKFTSDPVIYGLRMREVKVGFLMVIRRARVAARRGHVEVAKAAARSAQRSPRGRVEVKVGFRAAPTRKRRAQRSRRGRESGEVSAEVAEGSGRGQSRVPDGDPRLLRATTKRRRLSVSVT